MITYNLCKKEGIYNGQTCVYVGEGQFEYRNRGGELARVPWDRLISTHIVPTGREPELFVTREQIALRLGYAQTIHKSQGQFSSVQLSCLTLPRD